MVLRMSDTAEHTVLQCQHWRAQIERSWWAELDLSYSPVKFSARLLETAVASFVSVIMRSKEEDEREKMS